MLGLSGVKIDYIWTRHSIIFGIFGSESKHALACWGGHFLRLHCIIHINIYIILVFTGGWRDPSELREPKKPTFSPKGRLGISAGFLLQITTMSRPRVVFYFRQHPQRAALKESWTRQMPMALHRRWPSRTRRDIVGPTAGLSDNADGGNRRRGCAFGLPCPRKGVRRDALITPDWYSDLSCSTHGFISK